MYESTTFLLLCILKSTNHISDECEMPHLPNGYVSPSGKIPLNGNISLFCNDGFMLIGNTSSTCLSRTFPNVFHLNATCISSKDWCLLKNLISIK